jgi:hypothetical protein
MRGFLERDDFESSSRSKFLLAHDLFRKPVPTFRDHALLNELHQGLGIEHRDASPFEMDPLTLLPSSQLLVRTLT